MFAVKLKNIQAIGDCSIIIEDNSITEFTGDNSNGKSVLSKVIERLVSGDIRNKAIRNSLIKDGYDTGNITMLNNEKGLNIVLTRESSSCILSYNSNIKDDTKWIARQLSDADFLSKAIYAFGFRSYNNGDICLQLAPTFGVIPFVTTSGSVNQEIVNDITVDRIADEFLNSFKTITFPTFKNKVSDLKLKIDKNEELLNSLEVVDWKRYKSIGEKLSELYYATQAYTPIHIETFDIPDLNIVDVPIMHIDENIPICIFENYVCKIDETIYKSIVDLDKLEQGICPTCGRPLVEDTCNTK